MFLTSLCVLTLELALTRLFSATMYYHFAFLAISVALFGAGASGVVVFLFDEWLRRRRLESLLGMATLLFALSIVVALLEVLNNPVAITNDSTNLWSLTSVYIGSALPFCFAGATITLAISRYASDVSRMYLSDLVGAACGCVLLIPLLNGLGAVNAILAVAVVAAVAAIVFSIGSRRVTFASVLVTIALSAFLAINVSKGVLDIRWAKGRTSSDQIFSKWNSFSHITVTGGLNKPYLLILIDADAGTYIIRDAGRFGAEEKPPVTTSGFVYQLKQNADVLIIGPGGGYDVMDARRHGQKRITGVEVNSIIARDVMQSEPFKSYSGHLYEQPDVKLVVDEGRSFIRSSRAQYDVIQASLVDTWAATAAGAFALAENNLYTVEAFKDYIRHLTNDGILSMTRWYDEPPDQLFRLTTITREAMKEIDAEQHSSLFARPQRHFIILKFNIGARSPGTFLFKKSEFTDAEIAHIEQIARESQSTVLYTPHTPADPRFAALVSTPDVAATAESSPSNISPTRDNNPFFFNSLRLSHLADVSHNSAEWRKTNLGTYVLFTLLLISAVLVVLFIVGPLLIGRVRSIAGQPGRMAFLFYFAGLGLAFILVEMAMIQKFILFLGHPVYALAVVLFSLLCFCGIGSALTRRLPDTAFPMILGGVAVLIAIYVVALSPIFYALVQLPQAARIGLTVVLIAPLATMMGMPMPMGIRVAARNSVELIPWAWGLNGAASVLGSVLALVAAILTGFNQVLLIGAATYLLALLCAMRFTRAGHPPRPVERH